MLGIGSMSKDTCSLPYRTWESWTAPLCVLIARDPTNALDMSTSMWPPRTVRSGPRWVPFKYGGSAMLRDRYLHASGNCYTTIDQLPRKQRDVGTGRRQILP